MSDVKRRKLSNGAPKTGDKVKEAPKPARSATPESSEEESATLDVPSAEDKSPEAPKTFAELVLPTVP